MLMRIQKISNEGSREPFFARLYIGLFELRDHAFNASSADSEKSRLHIDEAFAPILDALGIIRDACKQINSLVSEHRFKIENRTIVTFQRNAYSIGESIDGPLRAECDRFLNAGTRALKGLGQLLAGFGLPIGCLFKKDRGFVIDIKRFGDAGHIQLVLYLQNVRATWSQRLITRRNSLEHDGWRLPSVGYNLLGNEVTMIEPQVDSVDISKYADHMTSRIVAFVEELVAYAFSNLLPPYMVIVEVPLAQRDPKCPIRFRATLNMAGTPPWELTYDDRGFPY